MAAMLSIQLIREHPDEVQRMLELRQAEAPLARALALDEQRRALLGEVEQLKALRNTAGKAIGRATDEAERARLIAEQREAAGRIDDLDARLREGEAELEEALAEFPNVVDADTPAGRGDDDNVVLRTEGERRRFSFQPQPHWEIGERLGIIDIDRAAGMAGSRMYLLRGAGAKLQRALIGHFLEAHEAIGYTEIYLPALVREASMFASGQLPKFRDNLYHDAEEDYWLIPTAEVPLTNLHRGEILDEAALPLRYAAHSPCFRREKVSAGRDVRGIKRVHQFEKVEFYQFARPQDSRAALEEMREQAERLLRDLRLNYRVVQLCSGALGFSASIAYDLEVWAPGAEEWLEVSSISNCSDFQARRANIRYRPAGGSDAHSARPQFVHTLNGSGLALPRIIAAIMETYQNADGSVTVPDVVQSRMGRLQRITAAGTGAPTAEGGDE